MTEQTTTTETDAVDPEVDEVLDDPTGEPDPDTHDMDIEDSDTFPREYVEKLRRENARYRERAGQADDLAHRLHAALVAATGRLADPSDLVFDEAHIGHEDALNTALDELLAAKPHLASRRPRGDVAQGAITSDDTVDLAGILRSRA